MLVPFSFDCNLLFAIKTSKPLEAANKTSTEILFLLDFVAFALAFWEPYS